MKIDTDFPVFKECVGIDCRNDTIFCSIAKRRLVNVDFFDTDIDGLKQYLHNKKYIPVNFSIRCKDSFLRWVQIPVRSVNKAIKLLPSALSMLLPYKLDESLFRIVDVTPSEDGKVNILVAGARKEEIINRLQEIEKYGISVSLMDHEGLTLWNYVLWRYPVFDKNEIRCVIYIYGEEGFVMAGKGNLPAIVIPFVKFTEKVIELMLNSKELLYMNKNNVPDVKSIRWIVVKERCSNIIHIDDGREEFLSSLYNKNFLESENLMARALAWRMIIKGGKKCNFLYGEFEHHVITGYKSRKILLKRFSVLTAGVLLCLSNAIFTYIKVYSSNFIERSISRLIDEVAGFHVVAKDAHAISIVEKQCGLRVEKMNRLIKVLDKGILNMFIEIVRLMHQNKMLCERFSLSLDGDVEIIGLTKDRSSLKFILDFFEKSGYSLNLNEEKLSDDTRFRIRSKNI